MKNSDLSAIQRHDLTLIRKETCKGFDCMLNMGLTKREMLMHAPSDIPEWFLSSFNAAFFKY